MPSLCENCQQRPVATTVRLDVDPVGLCQECFSEIQGVLEEDSDDEAWDKAFEDSPYQD